jgi:hypothetical protein
MSLPETPKTYHQVESIGEARKRVIRCSQTCKRIKSRIGKRNAVIICALVIADKAHPVPVITSAAGDNAREPSYGESATPEVESVDHKSCAAETGTGTEVALLSC